MSERPQTSDASLRSFEARLHGLVPLDIAPSSIDEGELLYRCGWTAALTQASTQTSVTPRRSWQAFTGGAMTGLAAACLGFLCFSWLPAELGQDTQSLVTAQVIEPVKAPQLADVPSDVGLELAGLDASDLIVRLLAWRQESDPFAKQLVQARDPLATASLSQVARRSWSGILAESDTPPGIPIREHKSELKPFAELLRELVSPKDIL